MTGQEKEMERKITLCGYQSRLVFDEMINISEEPTIPQVRRQATDPSFGNLNALPLEMLHRIFVMLDFASLSSIFRTCLRGAACVESLPEYRDLMRHAPKALAALGRTGLVRLHSAARIHDSLRSKDCESCGDFGPFLFLPTCKRCCYLCLQENQSFWTVPLSVAVECFQLSPSEAQALPQMRSIPGQYGAKQEVSRLPLNLVCVGTAKELAIADNKSMDEVRQSLESKRFQGLPLNKYHRLRFLQDAPLTPPGQEIRGRLYDPDIPDDDYCGMASVAFPHVTADSRVECGLWCMGCQLSYRERLPSEAIPVRMAHRLLPRRPGGGVAYAEHFIARNRAEFLGHVEVCSGAQRMIRIWD